LDLWSAYKGMRDPRFSELHGAEMLHD